MRYLRERREDSKNIPERLFMLVVSPLKVLMADQVMYHSRQGENAAIVGVRKEDDAKIRRGYILIAFGSPEAWLSTPKGRLLLNSDHICRSTVAVVAEEVHTVSQWYSLA